MARGSYCVDIGCTRNDERQTAFYLDQAEMDKALAPRLSMVCGKLFVAAAYAHCTDEYRLETEIRDRILLLDPKFDISKLIISSCKPPSNEDPEGIERALRIETLEALRSFIRRHPGFPFEEAFPLSYFGDAYIDLNRFGTPRRTRPQERPSLTLVYGNLK